MTNTVKVLLVEDNESDIKLVSKLLSEAPASQFTITSVTLLQTTIDELRKNSYDVILLDLDLPDSKGIATLDTIRKDFRQIAIVVFTISEDKKTGFEAINHGAQECLVKGTSDERILCKSIHYAIERIKIECEHKRVHSLLKESDKRFRMLMLTTSDALYRMSPDWSTLNELHGKGLVSKIETPNTHWIETYIFPDDLSNMRVAIANAISNKKSFELEHRIYRADGTIGWVISRAVPLLNEKGEIKEWFGAVVDITEQKNATDALRESEKKYRTIFDNVAVGITEYDSENRFSSINDQTIKLLGYTREQLIGKTVLDITASEDLVHTREMNNLIHTGKSDKLVYDKRYIRADGTPIWVHVTISAIRDSSKQHILSIGTIEDVTERKLFEIALKKSENKLKILNENLENLVVQRTEQVRSLSNALIFAEQRERKRFSNTLHESLQQKLFGARLLLNEHISEHLASGQTVSHDLKDSLDILNKAIQITKTLSLELNPPILQEEGLDSALKWLQNHILKNYGLRIDLTTFGPIENVKGDIQILITQMIRELLTNVIKHSGVAIASMQVHCEDKKIKIIIEDKGIGFDTTLIQEKASDTEIGIFSVRERLNLLGGQLNIESQKGHGTTCTIIYPYDQC